MWHGVNRVSVTNWWGKLSPAVLGRETEHLRAGWRDPTPPAVAVSPGFGIYLGQKGPAVAFSCVVTEVLTASVRLTTDNLSKRLFEG